MDTTSANLPVLDDFERQKSCDESIPSRTASTSPDHLSRKVLVHHVFDRIYLAISKRSLRCMRKELQDPEFTYFTIEGVLKYVGFADDFGPMSLGTIKEFCRILDDQLDKQPCKKIALTSLSDSRTVTNAIFLLGAYLIMRLDLDVEIVQEAFKNLSKLSVPYRDVSPGIQNFNLYLTDCWSGIRKARSLGWVDFGPGGFDLNEYLHYDDPLNADLHVVVPGKFIAMRGPKELPCDALWHDMQHTDGTFSHREFSPNHYVNILHTFNAKSVIRLNSPQYDRRIFEASGIAVCDLFFEDCTAPSGEVIAKFLSIAERIAEPIAVHCQAGLGRTGTLIATYMMKHHGFTARESIGWLRVVRPGSVIGVQQAFLCANEAVLRRCGECYRARPLAPRSLGAPAVGVESMQALFAEVGARIERRRKTIQEGTRGARCGEGPTRNMSSPGEADAGCKGVSDDGCGSRVRVLAAHVTAAAERRCGLRAPVGKVAPTLPAIVAADHVVHQRCNSLL